MEDLLGSEEGLHVSDQEQYAGVVKGWQFVVKFRVQNFICPFGVLHLLLNLDELGFVSDSLEE